MRIDPRELVELAYESIVEEDDPGMFVRAIAPAVAHPFGISRRSSTSFDQHWSGLPESFERAYVSEFHRVDPWVPFALGLPLGELVDGETFLPHRELRETSFFQELCRPHELGSLSAAILLGDGDRLIALSAMYSPEPRVNVAFRALVEPVLPHLVRAFRLQSRMSERLDRQWLARFDEPAFIVNSRGEVADANPPGRELLTANVDGAELFVASRRAMLAARVAACLRDGPQEIVLRLRRATFVFAIDRAPHGRQRVLVRLVAPTRARETIAETLRRAFQLTAAEIALVEQLGKGLAPKEAAAALSIAVSTVRTQLHSIFRKTGTDRQSSLLLLVERLSAGRRA
jgi:DNA-binding CsgD family transcriptional regulator